MGQDWLPLEAGLAAPDDSIDNQKQNNQGQRHMYRNTPQSTKTEENDENKMVFFQANDCTLK